MTDPALPRAPHRRTAQGKESPHEEHRHTSATPCKHHLPSVKINPPSGVFILSSPCCVILPPCHTGGECGQIKENSPTSDLHRLSHDLLFFPLCFHFQKERYSPENAPEGISRQIGRTAAPEPVDESMPTVPSSPKARPWLAGCVLHQDPPRGAPTAEIKINGRPFKAVLDTSSAVSLVKAGVLPPRPETKGVLPVTCAHGDTREVPIRRISISC